MSFPVAKMNLRVLLIQLDGSTPNIALMRLAAHHRAVGDFVYLQQVRRHDGPGCVERGLWQWDVVYASTIFTKTQPLVARLRENYPEAIIGGTGVDLGKPEHERMTLERIGVTTNTLDYSDYPACRYSIGFTQRGCRLDCWFCDVRKKEGKVKPVATIRDVWRGEPYPRWILLLDNDFFGQPDWRGRIAEMREGGFRVCFNQGINARMLSDEAAAAIASVDYRDDSFENKRIYTAWDSIGDEAPLFRGLESLVRFGVKPDEILVYMLVEGPEVTEADLYRQRRLREFGCRPYPMPLVRTDETRGFQRWIVRRSDLVVSWDQFKAVGFRPEKCGRS